MNDILNSQYIKMNISKKWLIQNDFKYNKSLSDEKEIYTYKFVVHKYKNIPVLFCELSVNVTTGIVGINVYDENSNMYHPFYHIECGKIDLINKKIIKKLKRLE